MTKLMEKNKTKMKPFTLLHHYISRPKNKTKRIENILPRKQDFNNVYSPQVVVETLYKYTVGGCGGTNHGIDSYHVLVITK